MTVSMRRIGLIRYTTLVAGLLVLTVVANAAGETVLSSIASNVHLIELYTSEGCSSCPPADRWLSKLKGHPALWEQLIPLAFHVDYWDYIGWKDRFSMPDFGDRQRRHAGENKMNAVYTPGLMSNGKEWRNFAWRAPTQPAAPTSGTLVADVAATQLTVRYQPAAILDPDDQLVVNVALLGFGLTSEIAAGENAGRELQHDFVVLKHTKTSLPSIADRYRTTVERPQSQLDAEQFAIAVWVSREESLSPLQAVGGWLRD